MELAYRAGLQLPELDLWLDPHRVQREAVISHAHSDHSRRHRTTIATDPTHRLLVQRRQGAANAVVLAYGHPEPLRDGSITLYPAGHVLGSAQVLIEHGGHRMLYSGDLKLRPSLTAEPADVPRADTLVVESTYGRPKYCFPPSDETIGRMERFCRDALQLGRTPILFAYPLGKSQEVIAAIGRAGLPIAVHPSIDAVSRVYVDCGISLPAYEVFEPGKQHDHVLLLPPQCRNLPAVTEIGRRRTAVVTGWALDSSTIYRFGCDAAFPLSDHASNEELLEYVERVGPSCVYTVHGFAADLARQLRGRGHKAYALAQPDQLSLF